LDGKIEKNYFAKCQCEALGKGTNLPSVFLCRVLALGKEELYRVSVFLPSVVFMHSGK
jgi:hypothetical protein